MFEEIELGHEVGTLAASVQPVEFDGTKYKARLAIGIRVVHSIPTCKLGDDAKY